MIKWEIIHCGTFMHLLLYLGICFLITLRNLWKQVLKVLLLLVAITSKNYNTSAPLHVYGGDGRRIELAILRPVGTARVPNLPLWQTWMRESAGNWGQQYVWQLTEAQLFKCPWQPIALNLSPTFEIPTINSTDEFKTWIYFCIYPPSYTRLYLVVRWSFSCFRSFCCSCVSFLFGSFWRSVTRLLPLGHSGTEGKRQKGPKENISHMHIH